MKHYKWLGYGALLSLLSIFVLARPAAAVTIKADKAVNITADNVVDGSLFTAGSTITIDTNVNGDVFCAGQDVTINGDVDGDILCAAQTLRVNGHVNGDIRTAVQSFELNGVVESNVSSFGQKLVIDRDAAVNGELLLGGQQAVIDGTVGKDLLGGAQSVDLKGRIGKDVKLDVEDLSIRDGASISGNLTYKSHNTAQIVDGAVAGRVMHDVPKEPQRREKSRSEKTAGWVVGKIISILSFSLLALLLVYLWPKKMGSLYTGMMENAGKYIFHGAVLMFLTPIAALIAAVTVIGLPLAFIVMLLWVAALVLSRVLVGFVIGQYIIRLYAKDYKDNPWIITLLGMTVIAVAFEVPLIGWLLSLVAFWWGGGALLHLFVSPDRKTK